MPRRRPALPYPEPVSRTSGPWRSVRETRAPDFDPERLLDARNMVPEFGKDGGPWRQRPAFERLTPGGTGLNAGARIRALAVAVGTAGRFLFAVAGQKLYRATTAGAVWTEVTGVTLFAGTENVYLVPFAGYLIVSDGINRPQKVTLDGAFTVSVLTDMVVPFFGRPVVYAAKLFGIQGTGGVASTRLVWSEELAPDTGYSNVNYANEWTLGQTSGEAVIALAPTNQGLYYFRSTSIGLIAGEVTPDFRTTATDDAVSTEVGTIYPDAVQPIGEGGEVWFLDQTAVLRRIMGTGALEAPGEQHPVSTATDGTPSTFGAAVVRCPAPSLVLTLSGAAGTRFPYAYDRDTGDFLGRWSLADSTESYVSVAAAIDLGQQADRLYVGTATGHVYRLRTLADSALSDDQDPAGFGHIVRAWLEPAPLGFLAHQEATWDRLVCAAPWGPQLAYLEVGPSDPASTWPAPSTAAVPSSTGAGYARAAVTLTEHTEIAIDVRQTRYLRTRLTARAGTTQPFACSELRVEGTAVGGDPDAK